MVSVEENTDTSHVGQVRSRSSASNGGAYSSPSGVRLDLPPAAKKALINRLNSLEEANGAERWTSVLLLSELDSEDDDVRSSIISWRNNDCIKHRFSAGRARRSLGKGMFIPEEVFRAL